MQVAVETLEDQVPAVGRIARVLDEWPAGVTVHGRRRNSIDRILRDLAAHGFVSVEGRGWDAGYRPTRTWLDCGALALASLSRAERAAVE
ncbi:MAG TPA: hypothetical protein VG963_15020, partial [Polyangiaceae bacterium]|nr:hypothetical protein [Polyangiaceae bacterium]